jgi:hypothetical protein
MREQIVEYFIFDGKIVLLEGLWGLVSPSVSLEFSPWEMIFYSFLMGFIFKKFHKKEWAKNFNNLGFITIPLLCFLALILLAPNQIKDDRNYYHSLIDDVKKMDVDYNQWRKKSPQGTVNPEWTKERDFLSREKIRISNEIIVKLSNQMFFLLFFTLGFFYKKYTIRNYLSKINNEYQTVSREIDEKKEREKNRIESEKRQAENERKAEELRVKKLEEKRLNIELEKERTKQIEAESSVKLKKLDVERPEKEKNLSEILNKLDEL